MRSFALLSLLLIGCATARPHVYPVDADFEDGTEFETNAWICIPGNEARQLRCKDIEPYVKWRARREARRHRNDI